jgi:hypothetical protein
VRAIRSATAIAARSADPEPADRLPDPATQLWPMGDMLPQEPLPTEIDAEKLKAAVNAAFQPAEGLTAAFQRSLAASHRQNYG